MNPYVVLLSLLLLLGSLVGGSLGFAAPRTAVPTSAAGRSSAAARARRASATSPPAPLPLPLRFPPVLRAVDGDGDGDGDPNELIARRIVVSGDVDGGYYRSCVKNEASRFRNLIGNMSTPDGSKRAEIYVEGKRKFIDGFIRWCQRGDVGLSQSIKVEEVIDESPTGLFDDFYAQTGR
ncbi:hypothetical protein ACHAWF_008457 [Thalassiosira exigua]